MPKNTPQAGLWLITVDGIDLPLIEVPRGRSTRIGRSSTCDVVLEDAAVSRQHAEVGWRNGRPYIEDLGSRHGTHLNGRKLTVAQPEALADGDWIRVGPWTLEARFNPVAKSTLVGTQAPADGEGLGVQRPARKPDSEPSHRILTSVMSMVSRATAATSIEAIGEEACALLAKEGGWGRVMLLRAPASGLRAEILASAGGAVASPAPISRTLITSALQVPGPVILSHRPELRGAHSLASGEVADAMCVAIPEDGAANYLLYALSATQRPRSEVEPAMLADVVAGACRVGIQSFQQRERERVHREIERELQSARVVQEQLLPASHGRVGTLDYAYVNLPGRFVSGDFVDVIAIDEHRTAVIVGDVMGEGPPAAVLMSSVVSQLRTALSLGCPVTKAVHALNQRLLAKPAAGRFVTLWVGLLDDRRRELRVIDAGHGLWFLAGQSLGEINPVDLATCPIGVVDHGEPEELVISLEPGASVVVVTDGITECRDPGSGALMGLAPLRSLALDAPVATCADDVMACAKRHAAGAGFRDDATVIVLRLTH